MAISQHIQCGAWSFFSLFSLMKVLTLTCDKKVRAETKHIQIQNHSALFKNITKGGNPAIVMPLMGHFS